MVLVLTQLVVIQHTAQVVVVLVEKILAVVDHNKLAVLVKVLLLADQPYTMVQVAVAVVVVVQVVHMAPQALPEQTVANLMYS
jgi:hypothetical protein